MKKATLLAAFFAVAALVGTAVGYNQYQVTRFNDLRVTDLMLDGNDILDSSQTTRITVGATNAIVGNMTITGDLTPSGTTYFRLARSSAPRDVNSSIAITPTDVGQLVYNSTDKELCMSTAAVIRSWIEVSTLAVVACRH